jgi:sugar lactone lactonase YvrE
LLAVVCLIAIAFGAVPAHALTGHGFTASFGANVDRTHPGTGICTFASGDECGSGEAGSADGQFSNPAGVAVGQTTGDVYVADRANNRVEYFDATGDYLGQFNGSGMLSGEGSATPSGQFAAPDDVAVDNSASASDPSRGDVYVLDSGHNTIDKYSAAGAYIGAITETAAGTSFGALDGVAVDANGVVWVYQASGEIDSFSDAVADEYLDQRNSPFGTAPGFAVDSEDNLYVNRGAELIAKLNDLGETIIEELDPERTTDVAVDPSGNDVYVDNSTSIGMYKTTGTFVARFGSRYLANSSGVAVNPTTGAVYATDSTNNDVDIFSLGSVPAAPKTEAADEIVPGAAKLHGELTSGSEKVTTYFSYDTGVTCTGPGATVTPVISAEASGSESATLSELKPNEQYAFCLVAENRFGASPGATLAFASAGVPPAIENQESAVSITATTATLEAQVNPNNETTHYYFEYATSPSLSGASTEPAPPGTEIAPGLGNFTATQDIVGLEPNTTYYYRVVAENGTGRTRGAPISTFTTAASPPTSATNEATAVTATTAHLGGVLDGMGADTQYFVNYGPTENYGSSIPENAPSQTLDGGVISIATVESAEVTGLTPNTTYHYQLVAFNAISCSRFLPGLPIHCSPPENIAYGQDREFTTLPLPPGATTDPPVTVSADSALLAGRVVPQGAPTNYRFEYGTSTAYGTAVPSPDGAIGPSVETQEVSAIVEGLEPDTTYHYRLVADNGGGGTVGGDSTFTTNATGQPAPSIPAGDGLTGAGLASPSFAAYASLDTLTPLRPLTDAPSTSGKQSVTTAAQMRTRALRACRKLHAKRGRLNCERRVRKQYASKSKTNKGGNR